MSDLHPQTPCAPRPSEWKGLGRVVLIPVWRTGFPRGPLRSSGERPLVSTLGSQTPHGISWMPWLSKALLRWGLPCEGGCLRQGRGRHGSLLAGRAPGAGTGLVPPRRAVPGRIGAAHPSAARPRSAGEMSATRLESKGGQRLSGAESCRLRSRGTCPSRGPIPEAARCVPAGRAWEPPQQSSVPRPRASPAAAARRRGTSLPPG